MASSKADAVAAAAERCFISPNVSDSNGEAANVVDVLQRIANGAGMIARAITPMAAPGKDVHGGHVESLTEAAMGITQSLASVAEAINNLADAVRETKGT